MLFMEKDKDGKIELPEVWCVIPHYGDDSILERCLSSLRAVDYPEELFGEDRIIVIDNNPPNQNLFFTGAVNRGLTIAREKHRKKPVKENILFWILNKDTMVNKDCLWAAVNCFDEIGWDKAGIVGCLTLLMSNPDKIIWGGSLASFPEKTGKTGLVSKGDCAERSREEWIPFMSSFINNSVVEQIGLLDQNFTQIFASTDYCLRARAQEWKCYYEPAAVVKYEPSSSVGIALEIEMYKQLDREYFKKKWIDGLFNYISSNRFYYPNDQNTVNLVVARVFGRPPRGEGETLKAKNRRIREGFFEKYCKGRGLDMGFGGDLLTENCVGWDMEHGDATYLVGIPGEEFDFVYSSHLLEDVERHDVAITNWWRVLKPGGYLIVFIPDRDLYEKKKTLPSNWNPNHKHFFLLDRDEPPDTIGLVPFLEKMLPDKEIIYANQCGEGHTITDPTKHSDGEYSIEAVIRKIK